MALKGSIRVPSDKSISHRAVLFAALAQGSSRLRDLIPSDDVLSSLAAVEQLGVFQPGGVQAAGIGPVFGQAFAHRSHNLRRGNGGGGIIQIVQIFVCQHKRNSFLRDDFPSRRVFR